MTSIRRSAAAQLRDKPMNTLKKILLVSLAVTVVFAGRPALAQNNFVCAWKTIQEKVDATNEGKFNQQKVVEELGEVDFLKQQKFETGGPCQKVYLSLAEFIDEAGTALSELGMVGYVRMSACLIRANGDDAIAMFKTAFTKNGNFKGADFDAAMKRLADDGHFEFDAAQRTLKSKDSGLVYGPMTNAEKHRLNHVFRRHTQNDDGITVGKSLFAATDEVLEIIDEGWSKAVQSASDAARWEANMGRVIGTNEEQYIRIIVAPNTTNVITAHPLSAPTVPGI